MLLSCDPGTKMCAFALYENGKLVATYKVKSTFNKLREFFSKLNLSEHVFVIEDQYLNLKVRTLKNPCGNTDNRLDPCENLQRYKVHCNTAPEVAKVNTRREHKIQKRAEKSRVLHGGIAHSQAENQRQRHS